MIASHHICHIDPRYCGPPEVTNGGFACGTVAAALAPDPSQAVAVTWRRPVPLDVDLDLAVDGTRAQLIDAAGDILAEGAFASLDLDVPDMPSPAQTDAASHAFIGYKKHGFPGCYVCGPERKQDGLHIFAGPVEGRPGLVASPWKPGPEQADGDGASVALPFIWAALDCPGYFAEAGAEPDQTLPAVLGRLTAQVRRRPSTGEALRVIGWRIGQGERRFEVGTAIADASNQILAHAHATWVRLRDPDLFKAIV